MLCIALGTRTVLSVHVSEEINSPGETANGFLFKISHLNPCLQTFIQFHVILGIIKPHILSVQNGTTFWTPRQYYKDAKKNYLQALL